jgi:bifunctional non-homologous end joining protein LigD
VTAAGAPPAAGGREALPRGLTPMLAVAGPPPDGSGWSYEFKWDGVRALAVCDGRHTTLVSRNGRDVTVSYPELTGLAAALGCPAVLDGEVVRLRDGRPDFAALQRRMHVTDPAAAARLSRSTPVVYLVFDVLHLAGRPLRLAGYLERRRALEDLHLTGEHWSVPPRYPDDGAAVLATAAQRGLEGVVAKRSDAPYLPGRRSPLWIKTKLVRHQEVVLVGWRPGAGRRSGGIGSLLLAVPGDDGLLRYAGHVGTGFTEQALAGLGRQLSPLRRAEAPLADRVPTADARDAVWVEPRLVGEVAFTEWTRDGRLRHPVWRGLRSDKSAEEVRRES